MKLKRKPSSKDLNLAVTILSDSCEGLSSDSLLSALKKESTDIKLPSTIGKMLTYEEVARRLSCSKRHVQYLCQKGLIKTQKIGLRAIRVSETELMSFLER